MEMPELPPLHDDEYEELKESKLGVFIKFQELGFDWALRLVHYMLGFQLDIKKKFELWSLVGPQPVRFSLLEVENLTDLNCEYIEDLERPHCVVTNELTSFWEMLGVHVEAGPSTQEIIATFERCEGWSRDNRKRLMYLAIFTGYIEGRKYSTPTQVWVYTALPELGATFGTSSQNTTSPPKPTLEPGSESVNGTNAGRKSLAEDKGPDVPAAVPADACSSKDKAPAPRLVILDKNQPTVSDLQKEDARYQEKIDAALALCRAKNDRTRKLAASQQSPYAANSTAKVIIPNKKLYPGYNPFAPIDKKKLKELADWLKTCPYYRTALDKKPRKSRTWWFHILRTSLEWLEDCHIDAWINVLRKRYNANPQHFRSERMCFIDHLFAQQWHYTIILPIEQGLGADIDDIYVPVNYADTHWIAMWISIPKRHIVIFNNICSSISPKELDVVMEHFLYMVPYPINHKIPAAIFQQPFSIHCM
uniref:Ubiquitin-like protease family profile domain-containing protein n=1 Tax=Brassica oleracea var. oleracea TaxID=109376 RepID=A0A0D3CEU6_BRAOL